MFSWFFLLLQQIDPRAAKGGGGGGGRGRGREGSSEAGAKLGAGAGTEGRSNKKSKPETSSSPSLQLQPPLTPPPLQPAPREPASPVARPRGRPRRTDKELLKTLKKCRWCSNLLHYTADIGESRAHVNAVCAALSHVTQQKSIWKNPGREQILTTSHSNFILQRHLSGL